MDALCLRGQCSTLDLQHLNAFRMFLQVSRLSDIASADGKIIRLDILLGKDDDTLTSSTWWPRQGCPPVAWWTLWRKKVKLVFSQDGSSPTLRTPLSPWLDPLLLAEWKVLAYMSGHYTEVYRRRTDGTYNLLRDTASVSTGHARVMEHPVATVDTLPDGTVPGVNAASAIYTVMIAYQYAD